MKCQNCNIREAVDRHHIFFGAGLRSIGDAFELCIHLCRECHKIAHKRKKVMQLRFCNKLGIDFTSVNRIMQKNTAYWSRVDRQYLETVREHILRLRGEDG